MSESGLDGGWYRLQKWGFPAKKEAEVRVGELNGSG